MEAFLTSTLSVAIAEVGDKTQLLSLFLATRFKNKWAIIAGIFTATVVNHGASAFLGDYLGQFLSGSVGQFLIAGCFIALGLWLLIPDNDDNEESEVFKRGAFIVSFLLFFVAEIGDKTQVATILLAAQYQQVGWVTLGTTLGMLLANVPVVLAGEKLLQWVSLRHVNIMAALLFVSVGVVKLYPLLVS